MLRATNGDVARLNGGKGQGQGQGQGDSIITDDAREPEIPVEPEPPKAEDLFGITNRLANMAGVSMVRPTSVSREVAIVKRWKTDGLDFDEVVIPAIERRIADMPAEQTVGSLSYFDSSIRKAHALRIAKTRPNAARAAARPAEPISVKDDADDRVGMAREALKVQLGNSYGAWLKPEDTAFHVNGVGLVIEARSKFVAEQIESNFGNAIENVARSLGLPGAQIRAMSK